MGNHWIKGVILALLIMVGGWALFQLILNLIKIPFEMFGVINPIWQYLAILLTVFIAMIIGWHTGLKGAVKKLVK